eukprot:c14238_g1_i2.p1 GENE.c14238_g1_i2~~c14238_g1_i2.p1  ORF type:complete len:320 (-),score=58.46 c14238_g1_i2:132-1091(-)
MKHTTQHLIGTLLVFRFSRVGCQETTQRVIACFVFCSQAWFCMWTNCVLLTIATSNLESVVQAVSQICGLHDLFTSSQALNSWIHPELLVRIAIAFFLEHFIFLVSYLGSDVLDAIPKWVWFEIESKTRPQRRDSLDPESAPSPLRDRRKTSSVLVEEPLPIDASKLFEHELFDEHEENLAAPVIRGSAKCGDGPVIRWAQSASVRVPTGKTCVVTFEIVNLGRRFGREHKPKVVELSVGGEVTPLFESLDMSKPGPSVHEGWWGTCTIKRDPETRLPTTVDISVPVDKKLELSLTVKMPDQIPSASSSVTLTTGKFCW